MALAAGLRDAGVEAQELPVADGGEGTAEVLAASLGGEWRTASVSDPLGRPVSARFLVLEDGSAVVEAAEAIGLRRLSGEERDPLRTSSRGLGELLMAAAAEASGPILVCLGDSATVDGGAGLREVVAGDFPGLRGLCDVRNPLLGERGAARAFGPQKGASAEVVEILEARLAAIDELRPFADLPGAGAAGGLGAAIAALGGKLVSGADLILDQVGFRDQSRGADLVVTGEGVVDRSSGEGKAVGEVVRICGEQGVRCVVFGGRVEMKLGTETEALSGDPKRAADDLVELGARLGRALLGGA